MAKEIVGKSIWYDWDGLNEQLFYLLNSLNKPEYGLTRFMVFITDLGRHTNFTYYVAIAAVAALINILVLRNTNREKCKERTSLWLLSILTLLAANWPDKQIIDYLKAYYGMPRPFIALPKMSVFAIVDVGLPQFWMSFPSGHSAFAMMAGASLWPALNRPFKIIIGALVLAVGLSRVTLGVHFPADVVGGFLVALSVVLVIRFVIAKILMLFAGKPQAERV